MLAKCKGGVAVFLSPPGAPKEKKKKMARRRRAHRFQKSRKSIFDGFLEAAIFENCDDWEGDWTGQSRSSWLEVDFQDFRDSGELGAGPEEDFEGF